MLEGLKWHLNYQTNYDSTKVTGWGRGLDLWRYPYSFMVVVVSDLMIVKMNMVAVSDWTTDRNTEWGT